MIGGCWVIPTFISFLPIMQGWNTIGIITLVSSAAPVFVWWVLGVYVVQYILHHSWRCRFMAEQSTSVYWRWRAKGRRKERAQERQKRMNRTCFPKTVSVHIYCERNYSLGQHCLQDGGNTSYIAMETTSTCQRQTKRPLTLQT